MKLITVARGLALAALLAGSAALAQAAAGPDPNDHLKPWLGLWEGRIGQQRVVMALSVDPASQRVEGRYFYERHGRDFSLWGPAIGQASAQALEMKECPADYGSALEVCEQPTATLTLRRPTARGSKLEGLWQSHGLPGRRPPPGSPLSLIKVSGYTPTADAFRDPYEQRRLKGIRTGLSEGGQLGPVAWQTLTDARSQVAVPQLSHGAAPKVLHAINQQLKQSWTERITDALTAVDHDDELKVVFANRRWLATTYSMGAYHRGAAHPITSFAADTYDLATGQRVNWARWFRFTGPSASVLELNRQDLLAAQVLKALAADVAAGFSEQGTRDPHCAQVVLAHYGCKGAVCASSELTGGRVPPDWQVWPLPKGLAVAPDIYSEADRQCRGSEVVLPWQQARAALLRPAGPAMTESSNTARPPTRRLALSALVLTGAAALGAGAWVAHHRRASPDQAGEPLPEGFWSHQFDTLAGPPLALRQHQGQPLLINFWATWCPPCVNEMPELQRFHETHQPKGWQVIGLAIDGPTPVREFLTKSNVQFPIGLAGFGGTELASALGNRSGGLPFSVLIDRHGRLRQRKMGALVLSELQGWAAGLD